MFQATPTVDDLSSIPDHLIHGQNVMVPPSSHLISDLEPFSAYSVRVACQSSQGISSWSPWVTLQTAEGGRLPSNHPSPNGNKAYVSD